MHGAICLRRPEALKPTRTVLRGAQPMQPPSAANRLTRAVRYTAWFGLSFEFLSDPWLCTHQKATEKVDPATVQRRSTAVADAFTPPFTPISSAHIQRAVNVSW